MGERVLQGKEKYPPDEGGVASRSTQRRRQLSSETVDLDGRSFGMSLRSSPLLLLGLGLASSGGARAERVEPMSTRVAVIVELFSSEGCSSCPPADRVVDRLDTTQPIDGVEVVAMEEHVDYWNRLGWTDPFSSAVFSTRQQWYAGALQSNGVYTPQAIVDGQRELNGTDARLLEEAIAAAARRPHARLDLAREPGRVRVTVRELPAGAGATVLWLALVESGLSTDVSRGENGGRTLRHSPIVRELRRIGPAHVGDRFAAAIEPPIAWRRDHLRVVVFAQETSTARILGAATLSLGRP